MDNGRPQRESCGAVQDGAAPASGRQCLSARDSAQVREESPAAAKHYARESPEEANKSQTPDDEGGICGGRRPYAALYEQRKETIEEVQGEPRYPYTRHRCPIRAANRAKPKFAAMNPEKPARRLWQEDCPPRLLIFLRRYLQKARFVPHQHAEGPAPGTGHFFFFALMIFRFMRIHSSGSSIRCGWGRLILPPASGLLCRPRADTAKQE